MTRLIGAVLVALFVVGCASSPVQRVLGGRVSSLVMSDAVGAADILTRSAPLLPPGDPWLACMQTIQGLLTAVKAGPGAAEPVNGILTEASRLHVLDAMMRQASSTVGQQSCAQIILQIELRAAAGALPGGALLPLR